MIYKAADRPADGPAPQEPEPLGVVPDEVLASELARLALRRGAPAPLPPHTELVGLALSGGGIRSATFSLGVLQAFARSGLLDRIDYLSTVSGGGYAGAFLGGLHVPMALRGAAGRAAEPAAQDFERARDEAREALATEDSVRTPGADTGWSVRNPVQWLRENGRYLAPTGAGDYALAAAMALRNLLAVHYVLGTALLALLLGICVVKAAGYQWLAAGHAVGPLRTGLEAVLLSVPGGTVWLSPLFALAALVALPSVPLGLAFFMTQPTGSGDSGRRLVSLLVLLAACLASAAALGTAALLRYGWPGLVRPTGTAAALQLVLALGGTLGVLGIAVYVGLLPKAWLAAGLGGARHAGAGLRASVQRIRSQLTRGLAWMMRLLVALALLAAVDTVAQSLMLHLAGRGRVLPALSSGALAAALLWLLKVLLPRLPLKGQPGWARRLPIDALATFVGVVLLLLLAVAWSLVAHWVLWSIAVTLPWMVSMPPLQPDALRALLAVWLLAVVLMTATGVAIGFLNLSSLQSLYSARLTRAYLGASNRQRFAEGAWRRVTEPHPMDNLELGQYFHPQVRGPLHLINVTLNQTTAAGEQLVQRDRKGRPVCVSPDHLCVDGAFFERDDRASLLRPVGNTAALLYGRGKDQRGFWFESLPLGQWCAISGAALSTGLGHRTSLGLSILCTLTNVRLGYWWNARPLSAGYRQRRADLPRRGRPRWLDAQLHLFDELRARFAGCAGRLWCLSDGGHYENTGAYELVRRRVRFIVVVDSGADPAYEFPDLANLVRLCRIDFGAEFAEADPATVALPDGIDRDALRAICGTSDEFGTPGQRAHRAALVYEVSHRHVQQRSTVLVIKPSVLGGAPPDVREYAACNRAFPQQATADQFFDQAQWESYRRLGQHIAQTLAPVAARTTRAGTQGPTARGAGL